VLPLIIFLFTVGNLYREGLPVPFLEDSHGQLQIWDLMISHQALDFWYLLKENLILWSILYIPSQIFFYSRPSRDLVKGFKFNPKYPSSILMLKEMVRSLRGVYICTVYESIMYRLELPTREHLFYFLQPSSEEGEVGLLAVLLGGVIVYMWGDAHFYFTHRLLHSTWLYKNVHKEHHESFNPTPFSGLSMHWFESMVYFSSAPLLAMAGVPLWLFRLMAKGLIVFPLEGHVGYGTWAVESSYNHYIHHAKFDYNYGSSPLWDHVLGTDYKIAKMKKKAKSSSVSAQDVLTVADKKRQRSALEQARLVGCALEE
jgi:sterol desaturase/sphingolipid hydroxylase (fatty acid hydroxylase superfamily)